MSVKKVIKLGDKVKDLVSGISGIAVGRTLWLHGCDRIIIQPVGKDRDGQPIETFAIDEPQAEMVQRKKVKAGKKKTGGPITKIAMMRK